MLQRRVNALILRCTNLHVGRVVPMRFALTTSNSIQTYGLVLILWPWLVSWLLFSVSLVAQNVLLLFPAYFYIVSLWFSCLKALCCQAKIFALLCFHIGRINARGKFLLWGEIQTDSFWSFFNFPYSMYSFVPFFFFVLKGYVQSCTVLHVNVLYT